MATNPNDTTFTYSEARGQLVKTMMREYNAAELAYKLLALDPEAEIKNGATSRSLASRIAWKLLPSGPEKATPPVRNIQTKTRQPLLVMPGARVQCLSDRASGVVASITHTCGSLAYLVTLEDGYQRIVASTELSMARGA